jgi:hypothetical protein
VTDPVVSIKVKPRSRRDAVLGRGPDGTWRIALAAPPVDGAANIALVRFLARDVLGVAVRDLALVSGERSTQKRVRISGLSEEAVVERLAHACALGAER